MTQFSTFYLSRSATVQSLASAARQTSASRYDKVPKYVGAAMERRGKAWARVLRTQQAPTESTRPTEPDGMHGNRLFHGRDLHEFRLEPRSRCGDTTKSAPACPSARSRPRSASLWLSSLILRTVGFEGVARASQYTHANATAVSPNYC